MAKRVRETSDAESFKLASRQMADACSSRIEDRKRAAAEVGCLPIAQGILASDPSDIVRIALASNLSVTPEALHFMARKASGPIRTIIRLNPNCMEETSEEIWNDPDPDPIGTIEFIIHNSESPSWLLAELMWKHPEYEGIISAHPSFEKEAIKSLLVREAVSTFNDDRKRVAQSPFCTPELLEQLASDSSLVVKKYVARNLNTPPISLLALSENLTGEGNQYVINDIEIDDEVDQNDEEDDDPDQGEIHVQKYASINPFNPFSIVANPNATTEQLGLLCNLRNQDLLKQIAGHSNCSDDIHLKLAECRWQSVHQAIVASTTAKRVLIELAKLGERSIEYTLAMRPLLPIPAIEILAMSVNSETREIVARNRNTPLHVLNALADDPSGTVRVAVGNNLCCPLAALRKFATDTLFFEYRVLAAQHPRCSDELFRILSRDPEKSVRAAVIGNSNCSIHIRAPLYMRELINK